MDLVVCRTNTECTGMDLGLMTPSQCCVQNVQGLAFNRRGEEACIPCVGKCIKINTDSISAC